MYKYDEAARGRFYRDVADTVAAIPGARSVAVAVPLPLGNIDTSTRFLLEGDAPSTQGRIARFGGITDAFFETLGVPLLAGRVFDRRDNAEAEPVVIVNQAAARTYWPGENPLGKRIRFDLSGDGTWATVVGVASDIHYRGLDGELEPVLYRPVAQSLFGTFGMTLLVRSEGDPMALGPALHEALSDVDPDAPLGDLRTMETVVVEKLAGPNLPAAIVSLFRSVGVGPGASWGLRCRLLCGVAADERNRTAEGPGGKRRGHGDAGSSADGFARLAGITGRIALAFG
ncbi:MAG: ABC transporter permease [Bryobacterales bacterium]